MTFTEAMRTTLEEFEIYNMAYAIQQEDKRLNSAIQAWFNQSVKAQKAGASQPVQRLRILKNFITIEKNLTGFPKKSTYRKSRTA